MREKHIQTNLKKAMLGYFERLRKNWKNSGLGLPRVSWINGVDPDIYVGEPDLNEWVAWKEREKTIRLEPTALQKLLDAPLHSSLDAYFNTYWFAAIEGQIGEYVLILDPILPGIELNTILMNARGYAAQHGGRSRHLPIGVEVNSLLVVVDNHTGEVQIEDWERGTFETIAKDLIDLLERLKP